MSVTHPFEFFIQWHLTDRCNLRCTHCYQEARSADEPGLIEIERTMDEAAGLIRDWSEAYSLSFNPGLNLTGGEPLLRPDLPEILALAKARGFAVSLLTNGTLVDRQRAGQLSRAGVESVQVSIEGPEEVHDRVRGKGSFAAAVAGVRHLVEQGLDVTLNATVSRVNAARIEDVVRLGAELGVRRVGFSRLVPSGAGRGMIAEMLTRDEARLLYGRILPGRQGGPAVVTGDPVAAQLKRPAGPDAGDVPSGGCAAGLSGVTLLPDGTILPCRRLPVPLGNIRTDSLREIWASSPVLEALRDRGRYRGVCGKCPRWAQCRGCRAIAYAWSRLQGGDDVAADDPQCFLGG